MSEAVETFKRDDYKYGFETELEIDTVDKGLNEDVIPWVEKKTRISFPKSSEAAIARLSEFIPEHEEAISEETAYRMLNLLEGYGLEVPANEWQAEVPSFDTLGEACAAGVQAEVDNAGLYDQLFSMAENPDLIRVFTTLQSASQEQHLPAFERCAP